MSLLTNFKKYGATSSNSAGIGNRIDVTYEELVNLKDTEVLSVGSYYRITDFATAQYIKFTTEYNTINDEPLTVQAIAQNQISYIAFSDLFPNDIIHYTLENSNGSITGVIYYRKDSVLNIETHFDFRNVMVRRYRIDNTNNNEYLGSTYYNVGDKVIVSSGSPDYRGLYVCRNANNSTGTFSSDFDNHWWIPILKFTSGYKYYGPNPTTFLIAGNNFNVNTDWYIDVLAVDVSQCQNIVLGREVSNVLLRSYSSEIYIGDNCADFTFFQNSSIRIGSNCYRIVLGQDSYNITIADGSTDITFCNDCNSIDLGSQCANLHFGSFSTQNKFATSVKYCSFSDYTGNIVLDTNCNYINLGPNTYSVTCDSYVHHLVTFYNCKDLKFGTNSGNITIFNNVHFIELGQQVRNIYIEQNCSNIKIDNNVNYVDIFQDGGNISIGSGCESLAFYNSITQVSLSVNCRNIYLGANCSNIDYLSNCQDIQVMTGNTNVKFETGCNNIFVGSNCDSLNFGVSNSYITIPDGSTKFNFTSSVKSKTFNTARTGINFLISSVSGETYNFTDDNVTINKCDPDGFLWYDLIDNLGVITPTKLV